MKKLLLLIFTFLPFCSKAQTINGKVYDAETTVKGALVVNMSQNIMTYTNDEGDFNIEAKLKDTLYISSLFHTKTFIEIKKEDFSHIVVIEVKKTINELDAILLRDARVRKFDSIKMASQLKNQIKEDMESNPINYQAAPSGNMNFIAIFSMISRLFKSKKTKETEIIPITYKDLDSLFKKDYFFNETLLTTDLNIPKEYLSLIHI